MYVPIKNRNNGNGACHGFLYDGTKPKGDASNINGQPVTGNEIINPSGSVSNANTVFTKLLSPTIKG